jgi:flagellar biosynthesis/type III secretory pathway protein FliH
VERKRSLSKIVREGAFGGFTESLKEAGFVRESLLRAKSGSPTSRDKKREAGREEGFRIGKQEGFDKGLELGRLQAYQDAKRELDQRNAAQVARFAASIDETMRQFESQRTAYFTEAEETLAGLVAEIARRAIARELEANRDSLVALAHQVLEEATDAKRVKLRVNPMDASMMEAKLTEIKAAFASLESIEVVEDKSIEFGCVLETDLGLIDARVEDYLERIVHEGREGR